MRQRQRHCEHGPEPSRVGTADESAATASFVRYRDQRDPVALEDALLPCAPWLQQAARRYRFSEAEDLVQECFVVAIRTAEKFDERGRLTPWLLGILHNLARSRRWRRWLGIRGGSEPATAQELTSSSQDPAAIVDRSEWLARVQMHLQNLPQTYRPVLHAHLVEGERPIEIARRLLLSSSTVRTKLERGLRELRRRLPAPMLAMITAILA
ncbi:MAG TPA: RNA polymerase sigma factor [Gemmatimonadaceae bacterium]